MLHHMLRAAAQRAFNVLDPYFKYVTMLLHGDGSMLGSTTVTPFNSDASTNAFNVTINGDARSNNFNPYQEGYYSNYFDGTGDYLSTSSSISLSSSLTVECWFNLTSAQTSFKMFAGESLSGGSGKYVTLTSTGIEAQFGASGATTSSITYTFAVGTWYHFALVRNGTTVSIYINGVAQSVTNSTQSGTMVLQYVGVGYSSSYVFTGFISNFRINTTAVYTTAFTPSTTPLTAISGTSLLTCQSNRFIDNSASPLTITKNGDTLISPAQPFTLPSSVATYGSGYFDGTGDSLSLASSSTALPTGTQDFSVEMYLYWQTQGGSYPQLISNPTTSGFQIYYDVSAGALAVGIFNIANVITYTIAQSALSGVWTHLAVTRSGTTFRLFVNGVLQANGTNVISFASLTTQYIASDGSRPYTGYMTDVRTVLGAIPTAYQTSSTTNGTSVFTPPTSPLTAVSSTALLTTQYNGGGNNSGFKDSSQFNFPITRNGNTTQGTFTPYGANWSNYFASNYLYFANNAALSFGTGDFCVEAWVYKLSASYGSIIDSRANNTATPWAVYIDNSNFPYLYDGNSYTSTTAITLNAWNHVAVTRSSGTLKIFVNGVQGYSATVTANLDRTGGNQVIGAGVTGGTNYFDGNISNLRVVKGSAVYTSAFTPSTTPLTAISGTSLLTCQSNRFIDNSGNTFSLIAVSSPSVQRFSPFSPTTAYSTSVIGGSAYFDNSGDYLTAPANTSLLLNGTNSTIEGWWYLNAAPGAVGSSTPFFAQTDLANASTSGTSNFWAFSDASTVYFSGSSDTTNVTFSASLIPVRQWFHLAWVITSGTSASIYLNGVSVASGSINAVGSNAAYITVLGAARTGGGTYSYLNGFASNFRIVKGSQVYTSAFTPPTAPLTAITNTSLLLNYTNPAILDNAMMNNLETVGNAQISTSVKKYGTGSIALDGTDDRLNMPSSPNLAFGTGDFTLECWAYFTSVANFPTITDSRVNTSSTAGFNLGLSTAKVQLYTTSQLLIGSSTLSTNTWYHIAVTRASGTLKIWLNGVQDATVSNSTNWSDQSFVVGATPVPNNYMTGNIDELRLTKGVARYTTTFTPPTAAFPNN